MPATCIEHKGLYYYPQTPDPKGWKWRGSVRFLGYGDRAQQSPAVAQKTIRVSGDDLAKLPSAEQMDLAEMLCRIALSKTRKAFRGGQLVGADNAAE